MGLITKSARILRRLIIASRSSVCRASLSGRAKVLDGGGGSSGDDFGATSSRACAEINSFACAAVAGGAVRSFPPSLPQAANPTRLSTAIDTRILREESVIVGIDSLLQSRDLSNQNEHFRSMLKDRVAKQALRSERLSLLIKMLTANDIIESLACALLCSSLSLCAVWRARTRVGLDVFMSSTQRY